MGNRVEFNFHASGNIFKRLIALGKGLKLNQKNLKSLGKVGANSMGLLKGKLVQVN